MSTTYFSWTYPVDTALVESGAQAVLDALQGPSAQDDLVSDESRGDRYLRTAERLARDIAPVALRFLDRTHDGHLADESGQPWAVSTLIPGALPVAVAALDEVPDRTRTARRHPHIARYWQSFEALNIFLVNGRGAAGVR